MSKKVDIGLIAGLFLPAVVRPILDSLETAKPVPPPQLSDVSIKHHSTTVVGIYSVTLPDSVIIIP